MNDKVTATDVLLKARDFLSDPAHWHQGGPKGPNGSRCVLAACGDARRTFFPNDEDDEARLLFNETYLCLGSAAGTGNVAGWNDSPSTTHSDLLAVLDRAIERSKGVYNDHAE